MRRGSVISLFAPLSALALTAAAPAGKPGDELLIPRIQAHFDSVLVELRSADVAHLTTEHRARRATLIRRLQRYRDRSQFPHNYDFPGQAVPYFVDSRTGTLCAVAHLMASTGRRDLVDRVAAANNNVWVADLAGDRAFRGWLEQHGLTLAEAARIQVPYDFGPQPAPVTASRRSIVPELAGGAAAGVVALNLMTNRDGHGRLRNWLGIATGVANVALGTAALGENRSVALTNVGLGALTSAISTRAMLTHRAARARATLVPVLPGGENGAGMSLNVTF